MYGIDRTVQQTADAYRNNPQELQQRYAMSQQLVDLLALQKLKSEKEAAMRDMQLAMQQQPGTVAQQREKQVLDMNRNEVAQRVGQVAQQQAAQQQKAMQQMLAKGSGGGGVANLRPQGANPPKPFAAGGIVALQEGGSTRAEEIKRRLARGRLNKRTRQALLAELRELVPEEEYREAMQIPNEIDITLNPFPRFNDRGEELNTPRERGVALRRQMGDVVGDIASVPRQIKEGLGNSPLGQGIAGFLGGPPRPSVEPTPEPTPEPEPSQALPQMGGIASVPTQSPAAPSAPAASPMPDQSMGDKLRDIVSAANVPRPEPSLEDRYMQIWEQQNDPKKRARERLWGSLAAMGNQGTAASGLGALAQASQNIRGQQEANKLGGIANLMQTKTPENVAAIQGMSAFDRARMQEQNQLLIEELRNEYNISEREANQRFEAAMTEYKENQQNYRTQLQEQMQRDTTLTRQQRDQAADAVATLTEEVALGMHPEFTMIRAGADPREAEPQIRAKERAWILNRARNQVETVGRITGQAPSGGFGQSANISVQ